MIKMKMCTRHKGLTPISKFGKDAARKDGYSYICKVCRSKVSKRYNDNWINKTPVTLKHGMTGTYEHESWMAISSKDRGVCEEWASSFLAFYLWVGPRPSLNHILHRENVKEVFKPGNARWATRSEAAAVREENRDKGTSKNLVIKFRDLHCRFIEVSYPKPKVRKRVVMVSKNPHAKWCPGCNQFLNKANFGKDSHRYDKLAHKCRPCHNAFYRIVRAAWRRRKGIPLFENLEHHGMCDTPEYKAWGNARSRTTNPNVACWPRYGGRGITMCQEWQDSFMTFYRHIGPRPKGRSLDRIDNDGNYEPGNCKWATRGRHPPNRPRTRCGGLDGISESALPRDTGPCPVERLSLQAVVSCSRRRRPA